MNQEGASPGFVPRHRPGHRSRVADLHGRIRASRTIGDAPGEAADPLSGNYTLVRLEDIVVGYPTMNGVQAELQMFPVTGPSAPTTADPLSQGATVEPPRRTGLAAPPPKPARSRSRSPISMAMAGTRRLWPFCFKPRSTRRM